MRADHPQPQFLIANPNKFVVRVRDRVAVGLGLDSDGVSKLSEAVHNGAEFRTLADIVASQQDATIILGAHAGQKSVQVWRGVTSNHDAYIVSHGPRVPPSVTDSFRDALALLQPSQRELDQDSIADHLLFTTVPGIRSLITSIERVGFGCHFQWTNEGGSQRIFDRFVARPREDGNPVDRVDIALQCVIETQCAGRACANQLSGGVDSTLLQTYLPAQTPSVRGEIDIPEYSPEREYSRRAQVLLGCHLHSFAVTEERFLEGLCAVIRRVGLPLHRPQTVVFNAGYQLDASVFLSGQCADSVFGLSLAPHYLRAFAERHWLHAADSLKLQQVLPDPLRGILQRRLERLRQVEAPLIDWRGHASRYTLRTNMPLAQAILGTEKVRERMERRVALAGERFQSEESDGNPAFAHLELGHMASFLCEDSISHWRQLAHTHGKTFLAPFACRSVVESALAVPRRRRYVAGGRAKHLLKDLLKRRLPAFDVNAKKLGSDIPIARFFTTGPLRGAFEQFPMPDFVDRSVRPALQEHPDWLNWNLLSLAVWQKEVLRDPGLAIGPQTVSIDWANPCGDDNHGLSAAARSGGAG
jgi:asparagine synthetase B (glutamine-hydrolysing)